MMNVTLIGMPGSGKSVCGVLLAKRLRMEFVDTDLVIQSKENALLREIIADKGLPYFLQLENEVNQGVDVKNSVIAPGGSVIYGREAMEHLKQISTVVYLKVSKEDLLKRLGNLEERGVAMAMGQTFDDLYEERIPLYERYADLTVDETGKTEAEVAREIASLFLKQKNINA